MPEADDFNPLLLRSHPVDDPIRPTDNLAQIRLSEFGDNPSQLWKGRQPFGTNNQFVTDARGGVGILPGDEADNAFQISPRGGRDDYLPAHSAILAFTSSMGIP